MPLTDLAIKAALPGAKIEKMSDGGGLQLWIRPTTRSGGDSRFASARRNGKAAAAPRKFEWFMTFALPALGFATRS